MKLYDISNEMIKLEDVIDEYAQEHMGDITGLPAADYYENLIGERNQKLLNLGSWFKSVKAEAEAYTNEIKSLQHKKKVAENKMQWIRDFITSYIKSGEKLKDSRVTLSWRKSRSVEINQDKFDIHDLPLNMRKIVETPDKTKIKEGIEKGDSYINIELVEKNNLQIK